MWSNLSNEVTGEIQIIISTLFFGISLVGQRYAMVDGEIGPITYNAARYGISTILLLLLRPLVLRFSINTSMVELSDDLSESAGKRENFLDEDADVKSEESDASVDDFFANGLLLWISLTAIANFGGSTFQQMSLQTVTASKVGFITGSYVVIIPFVEATIPYFHHGKLTSKVWLGALFCFIGIFLISGCGQLDTCFSESGGWGEIMLLVSVLFWVVSILSADMATKRVDCLILTTGEFMSVTVLATASAVILEPASFSTTCNVLIANAGPILFVAFTEAVAYFLSTLGQMYVHPSRAAILYSGGQALSACVFGYLFLGEHLSHIEILGGFFLLLSTLISSSAAADEEEEEEEEREDVRRMHNAELDILHRIHADFEDERKPRSYSVQYFPLLDDVTVPFAPQKIRAHSYGSMEMMERSAV